MWQKCPICNGVGRVTGGFYLRPDDCLSWITDHSTEMCRTCQGEGIIREDESQSTDTS